MSETTILERRFSLLKLGLGVIIVLSFLIICMRLVDPDLGWHLQVGEWVLANGTAPTADIYTYTMPGYPWVDHEWPVNAWLALMRLANAWWVVVLVFALLAAAPFLAALRTARTHAELFFIMLGALVTTAFVGVRAQILSFVLFALVYVILERWFRKFSWRPVVGLPLLFGVWANLHAGFFSGLMLFGLWLTLNIAERLWTKTLRTVEARRETQWHIITLFLCFAAPLANFYGARIYTFIIHVAGSKETMRYIMEWRSALSMGNIAVAVLIGMFVFLVLKYWRRLPVVPLSLAVAFLALFVRSARMGPLFFITALPIFYGGYHEVERDVRAAWAKHAPTKRLRAVLSATGPICVTGIVIWLTISTVWYVGFPYPEKATPALRALFADRSVVLFNDYSWGGYLIDRFPGTPIFIDGRMPDWIDASGRSAMRDYIGVIYPEAMNSSTWPEVFARRHVNAVLLKHLAPIPVARSWVSSNFFATHPLGQAISNLFADGQAFDVVPELLRAGWTTQYADETAVLLTCFPPTPCFEKKP